MAEEKQKQNPSLISEDEIPSTWHEVEAKPMIPGASSPSAPAPSTSGLPPYFRGSWAPNMQHDAQFVATDKNPRLASIPLMPGAPSSNPQTNAAIQSGIAEAAAAAVTTAVSGVFKGTWLSFATYVTGNIVLYNNSSYIAITGSVGAIPWESPTNWVLLGKNLNLRGVYVPPVATVQQSVSNTTSNGTPTGLVFGSNVLAGSRIVVTTFAGNIGTSTVPSITDSQGNTYTQVVASSRIDSNEYQAQLWISSPVKAGTLSLVVSWVGGTIPGNGTAFASEIANLVSSSVDASGSAAIKDISGSFPAIDVTVANGNLLYTGAFADATNTVPTGYTGYLAGSQTINVAWLSAPAPGLNAIQWNGTLNNSDPRFTGVAVSLIAGNIAFVYQPYDLVEFEGSAWLCIGTTYLSPASDPTNWALLAQGTGFVNSQVADYTALAADQGRLISYNSGSAHTLKLPATVPNSGWWIAIQNIGAGTLTLNPNGLLIDGSPSNISLAQGQGLLIFTDGASYFSQRGFGTVTNTTSGLTANDIILGNGGSDIKPLGSLGTTTTVLHGNAAGAPSFGSVVENDLSLSNVTTDDVSITKHGFAPKAPNDATKFLDGTGAYSVPSGGAGGVNAQTASYLAVSGDNGKLISFNSASGVTLTLPASPPSSTWWIAVEDVGAGNLTISPNGLNLDGSASSLGITQNQGVLIYTDGSNYFTERGISGSGGGGSAGGVNAQTANYAAGSGDNGKLISMNGSSLTLTLPASPPSSTWWIAVENVNSTSLTVDPNGLDLDGAASTLPVSQNQGLLIYTDGSNYFTSRGMGSGGGGAPTTDTYVLGTQDAVNLPNSVANPTVYYGPDAQPASAGSLDDEFAGSSLNTATRWTWVNQQNAVATVSKSILYLNQATSANGISYVYQTAPATPWTVVLKCVATYFSNSNYYFAGIMLSDSTGKLVVWTLQMVTGVPELDAQRYNSPTSFNATEFTNSTAQAKLLAAAPFWLSVQDDGTNINMGFSMDGINFVNMHSEGRTAFLASGPTRVGIGIDMSGSFGALSTDYFRRTQ